MPDRLFWFLLGCLVGMVIGYVVRSLREIKDKVDQVDKHITEGPPNDEGSVTRQGLRDGLLLLVVAMVVWASISSQLNSNKVSDQQDKLNSQQTTLTQQQAKIAELVTDLQEQQDKSDKIVDCNQKFLQGTIAALNSRTVFTVAQAKANLDLQIAFNKVVTASLAEPPPTETEARKIVEDYANALNHFIELTSKQTNQIDNNPYPTPKAFLDCLTKK